MLSRLFRSNAEVSVLGIVLFSDGLHVREIARRAGVSSSEAKKELDSLVELGVLTSNSNGYVKTFFLSKKCPFLSELTGLYSKTEGVVPLLSIELKKISGIKFAFIYGSFASGSFSKNSDIDLLVIGNADSNEVDKYCFNVQKATLREINYIFWNMADFRKKLLEKTAFILSILDNKKLWLIGELDEFERFVERQGNSKSRIR